ncbi:MAG: hypothetical protein ACI4CT_04530 [Lachnospiraceae bacterium]
MGKKILLGSMLFALFTALTGLGKAQAVTCEIPLNDTGTETIRTTADYEDSYFQKGAAKENGSLAKTSAALAALAYRQPETINQVLTEMGFTDVQNYRYDSISTKETNLVAFSLASRQIVVREQTKTLNLVLIRGTQGGEWYSNMAIAKPNGVIATKHYGFQQAATSVKTAVEEYCQEQTDSIIWIIGHSRGGAVGNLLAQSLTKEAELAPVSQIYAYLYAVPNVSRTVSKGYQNIKNYVNDSDLIPQIPLSRQYSGWGYERYGKTYQLNLKKKAMRKKIQAELRTLTGSQECEVTNYRPQKMLKQLHQMIPTVKKLYKEKKYWYSDGTSTKLAFHDLLMEGASVLAKDAHAGEAKETLMHQVTLLTYNGVPMAQMLPYLSTDNIRLHHTPEIYIAWMNVKYK